LAYEPGVEDLFFRIESLIIEMVGPDYGGNLQLARSRNDLGHALERMAFRQEILRSTNNCWICEGRAYAGAHPSAHLDARLYPHPTGPAGHLCPLPGRGRQLLAKDQSRLASAYANMNESPWARPPSPAPAFPSTACAWPSCSALTPWSSAPITAIGAGDNFTDLAFAIQSLCIGLSRVTHDLLNRATAESNALHVHDSFVQISSIMPQKRNPVVLEHLRARLSRAIGYAQTVVMQCHSIPYGDTQDIEDEIIPPLQNAIETTSECLQLYTAFFETVELNEEHLRNQSRRLHHRDRVGRHLGA
jgi:argininosuccinate lyase